MKIPEYENKIGLSTPTIQTPKVADVPREAFGEGVFKANQAIGDVGTKLAGLLQERAKEKYQIEQDQLETNLYGQGDAFKSSLLYDTSDEEINVNGQKVTRPKGIMNRQLGQAGGSTVEFREKIDKYNAEVLNQVKDPSTRAKLAKRFATDALNTQEQVIKHERKQWQDDKVNTFDSAVKLAQNNAASARTPDQLNIQIDNVAIATDNKNKLLGVDKDTAQINFKTNVNKVIESAVDGNLINDPTGQTARDILKDSEKHLNPEEIGTLSKKIDEQLKKNRSLALEEVDGDIIDGKATYENIMSRRGILGETNTKRKLKEVEDVQKSAIEAFDFGDPKNTKVVQKYLDTVSSLGREKQYTLKQNLVTMMGDGDFSREDAAQIKKINQELLGDSGKLSAWENISNAAKTFWDIHGYSTGRLPAEHFKKLIKNFGGKEAEAANNELMRQEHNKLYPTDPIAEGEKVFDHTRERQISFIPVQNFAKGIARGAAGSVESFGGGLEWLGAKDVGKMVESYGKTAREYYKIQDPKFSDQVAEGFGSMATFFLPGMGITKGVQAVSFFPRFAAWLGVSASTALEATVEAGSTYKQAIENGYGEKSASDSATATFWGNIPTIAITNKLGLFGEMGSKFSQVIVSGAMEGLQEFSQSLVSNIALHDPLAWKEAVGSAAVGSITGSGVKTAVTVTQTLDELGVAKDLKEKLASERGSVINPFSEGQPGEKARPEGEPVEIQTTQEQADMISEGGNAVTKEQLGEQKNAEEAKAMVSETEQILSKRLNPSEIKKIVREQTGQTQDSKDLLSNLKEKYADQIKALEIEQEIGDKLSKPLEASKVKNIVRENTGQVKDQGEQVSERTAFIQSLKDRVKAAKQSENFTKEQIFDTQSDLIDLIEKSDMTPEDKAKFIPMIKNVQTPQDLTDVINGKVQKNNSSQTRMVKGVAVPVKNPKKSGDVITPGLEERINTLIEKEERRQLIGKIRKTSERAINSKSIAVDYAKAIDEMVNEIDLKNRRPETLERIQRMKDFLESKIQAGQDVEITNKMIKDLNILEKKRFDDVSNEDLGEIEKNIEKAIQLGETKLSAIESQRQSRKEKMIAELVKGSVPIKSKDIRTAKVGERLTAGDKLRNQLAIAFNTAQEKDLAISPQDVVFDILDGNKDYKGANYRVFKQPIDKAHSLYLDRVFSITNDISALATELKLDDVALERIGFHAARAQRGGVEKLEAMGYTTKEIDAVVLNAKETKLYNLMREKLDELRPDIQEVMRTAFNKDLDVVDDYFPFMTDFEAMSDKELRDRFGDSVELFGQSKRKNVEKGFTKSRVGGKQKIKLNAMEVFLRHVDNASYMIELGPMIKELGDVAESEEYGKAVGEIGQERVRSWIDLLARKGGTDGKRWHPADVMRKHVGVATLGFKLSSALIQPTALLDGASMIGGKAFEGAFNVATSREWRVFLKENFPELRSRGADDPAYLEFGGQEIIDKAGRAGFWALRNLDALTASSITAGAYASAVEEKGGVVDLSKPDPDAIVEAQRLLRRTQASPFAKDLPSAISQGGLTGNVSMDKLILQFQTFMLNRWSIIRHDMYRAGIKEGNMGKAMNIAIFLMLANFAEIGIRRFGKEVIASMTGEELSDWPETYKDEAVATMLGNVPVVSQIVSSVNYGSIPVPSVEMGNKIVERLQAANNSKKDSTRDRNLARALTLAIGVVFKIPGTVQGEQIVKALTGSEETQVSIGRKGKNGKKGGVKVN